MNKILLAISLTVFVGCNNTSTDSSLNEFIHSGSESAMTVAQLQTSTVGKLLASPEQGAALIKGGETLVLWAGSSDLQSKWGNAKAKCNASEGGAVLCEKVGHSTTGWGMEIPGRLDLKTLALVSYMAAGRATGLAASPVKNNNVTNSVSISKISSVDAKLAGQSKSYQNVVWIRVSSKARTGSFTQTKDYYFADDGRLLGTKNKQEIDWNGSNSSSNRPTAEFQIYY